MGATVPLSAGVTRFPLGVACTTHDGLLPNGLTLDLKSVPPEDTHSKKSAFTALVLTRQEDIQTGTAAINLPLTLDSPRLKFVQGTYSRTTSGLYDTGKITGLRPQLLGSGYDVIREKEWKPIKEDQWMPHVRFFATINNPTAQAYDVKLACLFHVDNEAMITGNVPHRGVFTVRIPAKKTVTFGDGQKLRNLQATALRQSGLLGILLLASEVLVPQSDEHWHVPHVTNVSAAIISAMPVVEKK